MMQLQTPSLPDSLASFSWKKVFDWEQLASDLIQVAIIIVISFVMYRLVKVIVRRVVAIKSDDDDVIAARMREQRAQTLGGLFTNVAFIFFVTITLLTVLSVFINIGPLLASVSVVGLAISFGAQSLVKDVISGTFILIEGQFGIGDVVRMGDTAGLVEKMTLRTTVLRDLQGVVHTIPNGEITRVSNMTKTWSRAVIDVGVAYNEDIDAVIESLRRVGSELQADPQWGPLLVEPPEVLGVESLADSSVVVRVMAKTLPLKQWEVAREARRRIKKRFDEEGIEIPYPHLKVYMGDKQ